MIEITDRDWEAIREEAVDTFREKLKRGIPLVYFINYLIRKGHTNHHIRNAAKRAYPDSRINMNTVSVYRKRLRKQDPLIMTGSEAQQYHRKKRMKK